MLQSYLYCTHRLRQRVTKKIYEEFTLFCQRQVARNFSDLRFILPLNLSHWLRSFFKSCSKLRKTTFEQNFLDKKVPKTFILSTKIALNTTMFGLDMNKLNLFMICFYLSLSMIKTLS